MQDSIEYVHQTPLLNKFGFLLTIFVMQIRDSYPLWYAAKELASFHRCEYILIKCDPKYKLC